MKIQVITWTIALLSVACSSSSEARLESLKKKQDKIDQQIADLEQEVNGSEENPVARSLQGTFVAVEDLQYEPFNHYIEVLGKLDGDENVAVYPESMGIIQEIFAEVGDRVSAGQDLARMNDAALRSQLKALQSNLDAAAETFEKQEALWSQNIGSEMQYIQAKAAKESLEAQIAGLEEQIDMMHIQSPISGTVEESMIRIGQAVSTALPAFRVVSFNDLKVSAEVAEAYTSEIKVGDEVIIYLPDLQEEIAARVNFVSRYIDPANRTFDVEARLTTNNSDIKANMVAVMRINDYHAPDAIVLPVSMVQTDNTGSYVMVAQQENGQYIARKQQISVGQIYNGLAEITSGLEPEKMVISSGYLSLNEGETIRF